MSLVTAVTTPAEAEHAPPPIRLKPEAHESEGSPAKRATLAPVQPPRATETRDVRASQAALEAARQRTAGVLRSVATGVVALDRERRVTMANPRAEELLGVTLREGADVRQLTGESWQSLWEWVEAFAAGEAEPQTHELVVEERRIRAQVAPLGADGGCVVALDDTTPVLADLFRAAGPPLEVAAGRYVGFLEMREIASRRPQ